MELRVPGDKSVSQRALILAALANGESRLRGLLTGEDPRATAAGLRALGVSIPGPEAWGREVRIEGLGLKGLQAPGGPLDLQNSGTGARLLMGVLAGHPFSTVVTGDASLRGRPMRRVTEPLTRMGARFRFLEGEGRLPLEVTGGSLGPLEYVLPVASAQIKSALLLAGVVSGAEVRLREPGRSRDHTERMLEEAGVSLQCWPEEGGWAVHLREPPGALHPLDLRVPGDFSSAAFFVVLGLLYPWGGELRIRDVGLNPTRTRLLDVLGRMGGAIRVEGGGGEGERYGDVVARPSPLRATPVGGPEIPALIDEIPILAAAAARSRGVTRITGAAELRVKETDRIRAMVENLRALGIPAEEMEDGLEVEGSDAPLRGTVESHGDHRIAMAFGVLGALPENRITVRGREVVEVSFPGFWGLLEKARRAMEERAAPSRSVASAGREEGRAGRRQPVITVDGPAGSGKSSTAREVARRLGCRHLDSGALYRALTHALLEAGIPESEWPSLTPEVLGRFPVDLRPAEGRFRVMLGEKELTGELRTPEVTARVSPLSALPAVRAWLLDAQRRAGREGGLVADGRDMGTVVFPDAEVKVYLTAVLPERARRRYLEREGREPGSGELEDESRRIEERDRRDAGREVAPLRKPDGALEVDTSELDFEAQVRIILEHVKTLTAQ